jgi:tripartite ATP-independent transporter DctM subunit
VFYGFFVGIFVYRTLDWRRVYDVLAESAELSAVVLLIVSLAGIFAWAGNTLGAFDRLAQAMVGLGGGETTVLLMLNVILLILGMFLDAVSIFLIMLPLLVRIAGVFHWDLVWFGVMVTMNLAIGQFTPPMAVNLMVTAKVGGVTMESTVPWVLWMVGAMCVALALVTAFPELALWLPRQLGYVS